MDVIFLISLLYGLMLRTYELIELHNCINRKLVYRVKRNKNYFSRSHWKATTQVSRHEHGDIFSLNKSIRYNERDFEYVFLRWMDSGPVAGSFSTYESVALLWNPDLFSDVYKKQKKKKTLVESARSPHVTFWKSRSTTGRVKCVRNAHTDRFNCRPSPISCSAMIANGYIWKFREFPILKIYWDCLVTRSVKKKKNSNRIWKSVT